MSFIRLSVLAQADLYITKNTGEDFAHIEWNNNGITQHLGRIRANEVVGLIQFLQNEFAPTVLPKSDLPNRKPDQFGSTDSEIFDFHKRSEMAAGFGQSIDPYAMVAMAMRCGQMEAALKSIKAYAENAVMGAWRGTVQEMAALGLQSKS